MVVRLLGLIVVVVAFEVPLKRVTVPGYARWRSPNQVSSRAGEWEMPLNNLLNVRSTQAQYSGEVHFGTPAQTFQLLFDTGSSWTWVNDVRCSTCYSASHFNHSQSTSYRPTDSLYDLEYGSGRGTARLCYETVGVELGSVDYSVSRHPLLLMKKSQNMWALRADGIVGLAFNTLSDGQATLVESFKAQGLIDTSVFAIYLNDTKGQGTLSSSISFGTWDTHKYSYGQGFSYIRVHSQSGLWTFVLNSVSLGEEEVTENAQAAILDSGTSYLMCPNSDFEVIRKAFCTSRTCELAVDLIAFPCVTSDIAQLPVMTFMIDGSPFELTAHFYVEEERGVCRVLLAPGTFWILGAAFMRSYYALFDMENEQIGLVPSINTPEQPSSMLWWVVGVLVLVVLAAAGLGLCCCLRKSAGSKELTEPLLAGR